MYRPYSVLPVIALAGTFMACQPTDSAPDRSELQQLREELVTTCETYVAQIETKHELGVVGLDELNYARIQLLEAQLKLAESTVETAPTPSEPTPHDDQAIIALIENAIDLREKDLEQSRTKLEAGMMIDPYDVELARIRLGEVQLQWATAKNDGAAVIATLESLIRYWDNAVEKSERLFESGLAEKPYIDAQVAAIETRIRLFEAKRDYQ